MAKKILKKTGKKAATLKVIEEKLTTVMVGLQADIDPKKLKKNVKKAGKILARGTKLKTEKTPEGNV